MPILGVTVAILNSGKVLLTLREDLHVWCLPGGHVEPGESLAEAALRETLEETGLRVELNRLVGIYSQPHNKNGGSHSILFSATPVAGAPTADGIETLAVEWFTLDALPQRLLGWHLTYLQDAISGCPAVARKQTVALLRQHTRQELYSLRDQGRLDLTAVLAEICAPLRPEEDRVEVGGPTTSET